MRRLLVAIAAWTLLFSAAAEAARLPVYREPPSYKGRTKAPATLPPPAPAAPPAAVLSETGYKPDALVDEAGTAHIVWAEGNGDGADTVAYCRLKRGSTTCDNNGGVPQQLVWNKPYGTGDGPQYNTDYLGPRIVRVGNQLAVFSERYPTVADKPDGASGHTVIEWVSNDGGNVWTDNALVVGKIGLGQLEVLGPEDDPTILNNTVDPLCSAPGPSAWCVQAFKSGQYSSAEGNLSTQSNQNYFPDVALDETGRPVALATDAGGNAFVRRWSGQGSIVDPATWLPPSGFVADQPVIAGGPSGVWMSSKTTFNSGPFSVRHLDVGGDGTITPGAPIVVSDNLDDIFPELFEDPAGKLEGAWVQRGGDKPGVKLRTQTATSISPIQHMYDGATTGELSIGAAGDGGGFLALNRNVTGSGMGGIAVVAFGNQAATGQAGLGDIPGGAGTNTNVSCQKVDFGKFAVQTAQGCLLEGSGKFSNLVVSANELTIQGVRIVPDPGTKVIIDPRKLQIDTTGPVQVIVSNGSAQIVLFHGPLHADLSKVVPGTNLFEFPSQAFKANVLGFPVAGDIPVRLENDGVHIPVDLTLPPAFGGFTGHAELIANASGLQVSSLKIHAGPILLGALNIKTVDVDWQSGGNWSGHAELEFPATGILTADISFKDGKFNGATFNLPLNPAQPIGPFVYLLRIGGGFFIDPLQIRAEGTVGAGAPVAGTAPVNVDGRLTMTFPSKGPASFDLLGRASIFIFSFAEMQLEFQTDGYAQFRGQTDLDLEVLQVHATARGFVEASTGNFGADLKGTVEVCYVLDCTGPGAAAAMSNEGFIACGELLGASGGLKVPWDDIDPTIFVNPFLLGKFLVTHVQWPCHTSDYTVPPPRPFTARSSATGGQVVTIPRGLPTATLVAEGDSQAPDITVTGPGGIKLVSGQKSKRGGVIVPRGVPATYAMIKNPPPGDYTIAPNEGSVDIVRVLSSNGYRAATVNAKLRGRKIGYRIANGGNGQRVVFQERGRVGTHTLGAVTKSRGTLRFKPTAGPGGKRTVVALIQKDGFTTRTVTVGSFKAPAPPKPGAVRRLRAVHRAHKLTVSWRAAGGAASYVLKVRGSKGTKLTRALGKKARGVKFPAVRRDERFTATVYAVSKGLRPGPARSAKSR